MICKLFGLFGDYCVRLPISCVTQGRGRASNANPEMARARAAKIAIMQEPEDNDTLKGGIIKDVTGGEPYFARFLHDNGREVKNTFKLILMCNKIPVIPNAGKAVENRLRIFPFLSTWVDDAPADPEEQMNQRRFQKDPFFEERIPVLMPAFLWVLKEIYPDYVTEGLEDPPIIKEHTETYWKENDTYQQFINDWICEAVHPDGTRDVRAMLTLSKIYTQFKT
jgi:putative DNA primase/helicase